jgi:hypothetical protein
MENSRRPVVIRKAHQGYRAYRQMLLYYSVKNLLDDGKQHPPGDFAALLESSDSPFYRDWVNLGGQLIPAQKVDQLRSEIRSGQLASWGEIHQRYEELWNAYPAQKQRHALGVLLLLLDQSQLTPETWHAAVKEAVELQDHICEQVYLTRQKDYESPFRGITFRNPDEMQAVLGTAEQNSFVKQVRAETEAFRDLAERVLEDCNPAGTATSE